MTWENQNEAQVALVLPVNNPDIQNKKKAPKGAFLFQGLL